VLLGLAVEHASIGQDHQALAEAKAAVQVGREPLQHRLAGLEAGREVVVPLPRRRSLIVGSSVQLGGHEAEPSSEAGGASDPSERDFTGSGVESSPYSNLRIVGE
jgi:hypothetical protein